MASTAEPAVGPRPKQTKVFAVAALGVAFAALLAITLGGIGKNIVYYWGPTELKAAGEKAYGASIRLGGLVADGSIQRPPSGSSLEFDVLDRKGERVHVKCSGVPPQLFRERIGVVIEGTMAPEGYFKGNRLMVSHNNEYRAPSDKESVAIDKLMKTTQGIEGQK